MLKAYYSTKEKRLVKVGDKVTGWIQGEVFYKSVIGSKHKLRFPLGWAIDADVWDNLLRGNVNEIAVIDRETGIEYHTTFEVFDRLKGELDRGFGRQYFLTLTPNHWEIRSDSHRQLSLLDWRGEFSV